MEIQAETKLPRLRFLSTSLDHTIRLWDTDAKMSRNKQECCIGTFHGHSAGVTCMALLGKDDAQIAKSRRPKVSRRPMKKTDQRQGSLTTEHESTQYFVSGSQSGEVKLWNLEGHCLGSFIVVGDEGVSVTSVATVRRGETFVCGYNSGVARLWAAWSEVCMMEYHGHRGSIECVCSMEDSYSFLSGSTDGSIRLWDTSLVMDYYFDRKIATHGESLHEIEQISKKTFIGHSGPVLSLVCVEPGVAFLSGSQDNTCRLWSVESASCLRVFSGHAAGVKAVAAVDQVTFLSGSEDETIKIWDAISGDCLRTYTGHSGQVTAVSMAQNGAFISGSTDKTIKLWVFTAVAPNKPPEESLGEMLEINDNMCANIT